MDDDVIDVGLFKKHRRIQFFARPDGSLETILLELVQNAPHARVMIMDTTKRLRRSGDIMLAISKPERRFSLVEPDGESELIPAILALPKDVELLIIHHLTFPFRSGMVAKDNDEAFRKLGFILAMLLEREELDYALINEARKKDGGIVPVAGALVAKYVDCSFKVDKFGSSIRLSRHED